MTSLMISTIRCVLPGALAVLAACAPLTTPPQTEHPTGRARLVLPAGAWEDLGAADEAIAGGQVPLQTRTVGLRGAGGEWLAVLRVQTNRSGDLRGGTPWSGPCPAQQDVTVEDAAAGSPVRADCLRLKRWGSAQWLEKNRPELLAWLRSRSIALQSPYSHLIYRYTTDGGAVVAVEGLVDQRLLSKRPRNNQEFLVAGEPALHWARDLAQAARLSVSMMDGHLAVPPFPFPAIARASAP